MLFLCTPGYTPSGGLWPRVIINMIVDNIIDNMIVIIHLQAWSEIMGDVHMTPLPSLMTTLLCSDEGILNIRGLYYKPAGG